MSRRNRSYGPRRRARRIGAERAAEHIRARAELSRELGGTDLDVLQVFFELDDNRRAELFRHYRGQFGDSAASYARAAYSKWKSGQVKCSGQTVSRLIAILPAVIDFKTKCWLLQRIRERTRKRDTVCLSVDPSAWQATVIPHLEAAIGRPFTYQLPAAVARRLTWLSSDDGQLATRLLAEVEAAESAAAAAFVEREMRVLGKMISDIDGPVRITHVITLPCVAITLEIKGRRKMSSSDKPARGDQSLFAPNTRDMIDSALGSLTEAQRGRIAEKAAEEALRLSAEAKRAEIRSGTAEHEINNFVNTVHKTQAAARGSEFSLTSTIETASGTTTIQVRRSPWLVPALVFGAIALLVLAVFAFRN